MKPLMKTKVLIITLCAFALAACDNEPGNPRDKNELVKDVMAINLKHYSEADQYLLGKDYAAYNYNEPVEGEGGWQTFCKPKEIAENSDSYVYAIIQSLDPYQTIEYRYDENGYLTWIKSYFRSSTDKNTLKIYKSWVKYLEEKITPTTTFYGEIIGGVYTKEDTLNYRTLNAYFFDGFEQEWDKNKKEYVREKGYTIGTLKDFDDMLDDLSLSDILRVDISFNIDIIDEQQNTATALSAKLHGSLVPTNVEASGNTHVVTTSFSIIN